MNDVTKYPIDADEFADGARELFYSVAVAFNTVVQTINEISKELPEVFLPVIIKKMETNRALSWAAEHEPKLYHYAVYCKKSRIRNKYIKKIMKLQFVNRKDIYDCP